MRRKEEKHMMSYSSEYSTWKTMKQRCLNPKAHAYNNYGGRGIKVCERWKNSFINFYADMGDKPHKKATIDRIDNNGDYTPNNCRWVTNQRIQAVNKRIRVNNTSGTTGVTWYSRLSMWHAKIYVNGKKISLKYHKDKENAIKARKLAEKVYLNDILKT